MGKILLRKIYLFSAIYFLLISSLQANGWEHVAKASFLLKQGNIQAAIKEYRKAIKENPQLVEVYSSLGYIYQYKLKDYKKAVEVYLKGLEYAPHDYGLNLNLMYLYFGQGDIKKGIEYYKLLSNLRSGNKSYSFPRETLNSIIEDMREGQLVNFCKKYSAMNPTDTNLRRILVDVYKKKKDYKSAESELKAMLRYGVETSDIYFDLGTCNYNLGHYKEALKYFSNAQQLGAYVPQEFFDRLHKEIEKSQ